MHLFDQSGGVEGPGKILRDMDTQELEASRTLHFGYISVDGSVCVWPFLVCRLSTISSFVFWVLSAGLLLAHHTARCQTSSLRAISSLQMIRPTTVVSSANLIMDLEPCSGMQLLGSEHSPVIHHGVYSEDGGVVIVDPNRLWFVSEKVQGPGAKQGADAKISEIGDQLGWDHSVEGRTAIVQLIVESRGDGILS